MESPLTDVEAVQALGGYRVWLRFEDGSRGEPDLGRTLAFRGVFAKLKDEREFARVRVDAELETITWPGGADRAPEELYRRLLERRDAG